MKLFTLIFKVAIYLTSIAVPTQLFIESLNDRVDLKTTKEKVKDVTDSEIENE